MNTEKLIASYRHAAFRHRTAIEQGKPRIANRAADRIEKLFQQIRQGGPEVQRAFLALLHDEHPGVRVSAAADALEFAPEQAVPVLKELAAKQSGLVGFVAEFVLERWEAGKLDPS